MRNFKLHFSSTMVNTLSVNKAKRSCTHLTSELKKTHRLLVGRLNSKEQVMAKILSQF